jgi:hypothetical protein
MAISKRPSRAVSVFGSPLPSPKEGVTYTMDEARNKYERFFRHYGITLKLSNSGEQFNGDCPFPDCGKPEGHFYVSVSSGQWDCKFCGKNGNVYSFMYQLLTQYSRNMTTKDYQWLAKQRPGISPETFKLYSIARFGPSSVLLPSYSLPQAKTSTTINSLPIWREVSEDDGVIHKILNPPIISSSIFGLQFWKPRMPVYVCEGQWDVMALHSLTSRIKKGKSFISDQINIIGVPGTTNFPQKSLSLLSGVDVYILFDNDAAGLTGQDKLIAAISNEGVVPRSVHSMSWPAHYDTGFDVRDLVHKGVI